jgi:hypothetical protein
MPTNWAGVPRMWWIAQEWLRCCLIGRLGMRRVRYPEAAARRHRSGAAQPLAGGREPDDLALCRRPIADRGGHLAAVGMANCDVVVG